MKHLKNSREKP